MKKDYFSPQTRMIDVLLNSRILDASLGGSTGENINSSKNTYNWDWDEE